MTLFLFYLLVFLCLVGIWLLDAIRWDMVPGVGGKGKAAITYQVYYYYYTTTYRGESESHILFERITYLFFSYTILWGQASRGVGGSTGCLKGKVHLGRIRPGRAGGCAMVERGLDGLDWEGIGRGLDGRIGWNGRKGLMTLVI